MNSTLRRLVRTLGLYVAKHRRGYVYVDHTTVWAGDNYVHRKRDERFLALATPVIQTGRTLLNFDRLYVFWQAIRNVAELGGVAAEIGSYKGGSAYFIASVFREITGEEQWVHVFDTFEGHPNKITSADSYHEIGMFSDTTYGDVSSYLSEFPGVRIHRGEFSKTAESLDDFEYSLVHIDVDIYQTTLDCLRYFAPRLLPGGIFVIDDYFSEKCPGVRKAVVEFMETTDRFETWDMRTQQLILTST